jgi:hypothetical protein
MHPGREHRAEKSDYNADLICLRRPAVNNPNAALESERVGWLREGHCRKKGWFSGRFKDMIG